MASPLDNWFTIFLAAGIAGLAAGIFNNIGAWIFKKVLEHRLEKVHNFVKENNAAFTEKVKNGYIENKDVILKPLSKK